MPTTPTLVIALSLAAFGQATHRLDERQTPPEKRLAAAGRFQAELSTPDHWKSHKAHLRFFADKKLLWDRILPHALGPRYFVLTKAGTVCLVDEFANIKSERGLMAFDAKGVVLFEWSVDEIQAVLGVSDDQMIEKAARGWWVSAPPSLDGEAVTIATAGVRLRVDLKALTMRKL